MGTNNTNVNLGIINNTDGYSIEGGKDSRRSFSITGDDFPVSLSAPSSNQVLTFYNNVWTNREATGGSGIPGGSDTEIQYNNGGSFGGAEVFYDDSNQRVGINKTPETQLDITGKVGDNLIYLQIDGLDSTERGIYISESGTWKWAIFCDSGESSANLYINNSSKNIIKLDTNGLTVNGNLYLDEAGAGTDLLTISCASLGAARTYTIPDAGSNANFIVSPSTPAQGDILYYNGTTWVSLTAGTSGYYLKTQGAGANPVWAEVASGPTSGYDTLWLPAGAAISSNTAGALNSDREYPTYDVNIDVVEFSPIVDEYVEFNVVLPDNWDLGTLKAKFYWTYDVVPTSGTTVEFGIEASAKSNDDAIDAAWGTEVVVTDTAIAVNDLHITSATSAITVGGTISVGDLINIRVGRNSTSVNDDLSSPVLLIGVLLQFYRSGSISGW